MRSVCDVAKQRVFMTRELLFGKGAHANIIMRVRTVKKLGVHPSWWGDEPGTSRCTICHTKIKLRKSVLFLLASSDGMPGVQATHQ